MIASVQHPRFGFRYLVLLIAVSLAALTGCGKSESIPDRDLNEGLPAEAVAVRKAFESASISKKNSVEEVLRLLKGQNRAAYQEALPQLQMLAANPTMTPEQKAALDALIAKLKSGR